MNLPEIKPLTSLSEGGEHVAYQIAMARHILSHVLPEDYKFEKADSFTKFQEQKKRFNNLLPLVSSSELKNVPFNLSFYLLTKHRLHGGKFFFDIISKWIVPGKFLNIDYFFGVDFLLPQLGDDIYTAAHLSLRVEKTQDLYAIEKNLDTITREIRLGTDSPYHASRILEVKGFSSDDKTGLIQENIVTLLKRRPDEFNYDTLADMQHFLVTCGQEFKELRDYRHMSRIIYVQYLLKRSMLLALESYPDRRHVYAKVYQSRLHIKDGEYKKVVGILACINLIRDNEVFEERHLLRGVHSIVPGVKMVEGSYLSNSSKSPPIITVYAEFEKFEGERFTPEEVKDLKEKLGKDLKSRVEHLMHPVFMPRNEEEILRHIVTLSDQLRFARDLPQVMICYDNQLDEDINFTIILLRLLKQDSPDLVALFQHTQGDLEFYEDRVRTVGYLRKKYPKEAHVFGVKLEKHAFLREDNSIDLYKARQRIALELKDLIGEFRDYNGGMISKESEAFASLKALLMNTKSYQDILLENFFYSLEPNVLRSVLEPTALRILFLMLINEIEDTQHQEEGFSLRSNLDTDFAYVVLALEDASQKDKIMGALKSLSIPTVHMASSLVTVAEKYYLSLVYRCYDEDKKNQFITLVKATLANEVQDLLV